MLKFAEIIARTEREIENLRTAPIGTEIEDFEIEDEQERARLLKIATQNLENLRNADPYIVEKRYQNKSILFCDDFMD